MAFTQKHIDALNEALASNVLEVNFGDRRVRYGSVKDIERAKLHIQKEMRNASARRGTITSYRVNVSKL